MNYKEILEDVIDLQQSGVVVVRGYFDIVDNTIKDLSYFTILGFEDDSIKETIEDLDLENRTDGEYEFSAVLKYQKEDYGYDYYELYHIDLKLIQTIKQRERDSKLNELFLGK